MKIRGTKISPDNFCHSAKILSILSDEFLSDWIFHGPLTSDITALCSDRNWRFGHASENHSGIELKGTVNFNQSVVSKQIPFDVRGVRDHSLHHTNLLRGFPVHPDVSPHHNSVITWIVFVFNTPHTMAGC